MKNRDMEQTASAKKKIDPFKLLNNERTLSVIVMIGLLGIGLIFVSSYLSPSGTDVVTDEKEESLTSSFSQQYKDELTEELGNMIASIAGAGRTKVMITLKGTSKDIYAADTDINGKQSSKKAGTNENADNQNTEKKKYTIVRSKDGSEKALTLGQLMPEVKGVLVICDGGEDEIVREKIIQAVSAALDISKQHIYVTGLQDNE